MTLLESLVAALVFTGVATASLGIWSLGLAAEADRARRQQGLDRIDAELNAVDLRLRGVVPASPALLECAAAAELLAAAAAQVPLGEGLVRQVSRDPGGEGLWVTVAAAGQPGERRRWFSAAALGLCGGWGGTDAAL